MKRGVRAAKGSLNPILSDAVREAEQRVQSRNAILMQREDTGAHPASQALSRQMGTTRYCKVTRKRADGNLWWTTSDPPAKPAENGTYFPRDIGGTSGRDFLECSLLYAMACGVTRIDDLAMWAEAENHGPPEVYERTRKSAFFMYREESDEEPAHASNYVNQRPRGRNGAGRHHKK